MRTSLTISSFVVVSGLVAGLAACGGKSRGPVSNGGGGGGGAAGERLPWEAALTVGAHFELIDDLGGPDQAPLPVTVTAVEQDGAARIYRLHWGGPEDEGANGPTTIRVEGTAVTINDAKLEDMQAPFPPEDGDAICYGEDMSNPGGCDDICDANLCLSPTAGIVSVYGLYAPGYSSYSQR